MREGERREIGARGGGRERGENKEAVVSDTSSYLIDG